MNTKYSLDKIVAFRSVCYNMAASGKHGDYPYDETFNDEVEEGFSDDGTIWTAHDGTVLTINGTLLTNED